ncbi:protein YgfX [Candidatus Sororendozoicomonas aggregata]|uniref:protein YgfX n=1 Tax=Candidatus Sororendozoicomonas aggregata TaxID=3073239 RepID=UPI002ED41788
MRFEAAVKPSRLYRMLCIGVYSAAVGALWVSDISFWLFCLSAILLALAGFHLCQSGVEKKVNGIRINAGVWAISIDGRWFFATRTKRVFLSQYFLVIPLTVNFEEKTKKYSVILFRDSLCNKAWRQLRIFLRLTLGDTKKN